MSKPVDLSGQTFGLLRAIEQATNVRHRRQESLERPQASPLCRWSLPGRRWGLLRSLLGRGLWWQRGALVEPT